MKTVVNRFITALAIIDIGSVTQTVSKILMLLIMILLVKNKQSQKVSLL